MRIIYKAHMNVPARTRSSPTPSPPLGVDIVYKPSNAMKSATPSTHEYLLLIKLEYRCTCSVLSPVINALVEGSM
jgi:hypothetical protein